MVARTVAYESCTWLCVSGTGRTADAIAAGFRVPFFDSAVAKEPALCFDFGHVSPVGFEPTPSIPQVRMGTRLCH
jgi:hypothetical protein